MNAFALVAPGTLGPAPLPDEPAPGPGQAAVKPLACGICASDVHYWLHGRIGSQVITSYPFALGHEAAGVVTAVGPGVTSLRAGQRVAIDPARPCGRCPQCRENRQNLCPSVLFLGTPMVQGALRDSILTEAGNLQPIPDSLSFEDAALCEPLGIGIHAVRLANLQPGETVAVFGAGPVGLAAAVAARARGAARILIVEPVKQRRLLAAQLGFETLDIDPDPVDQIRRSTLHGVDLALEAAGDPRAIAWALAATRPGRRACIIGIPAEDSVPLDIHSVRHAELTIHNSRRSNRTLPEALAMIAGPAADYRRITTHRFQLTDAERAFDLVSKKADGVVKAMLMLD